MFEDAITLSFMQEEKCKLAKKFSPDDRDIAASIG
jgi:hypothetical protein